MSIKVENLGMCEFETAIREIPAKGYRRTKTGYETFISNHSKSISLGTYKTEQEAVEVVFRYRVERFKNGCEKIGLNPADGKLYENNYIVFPSGKILNLHGREIKGHIDRCGYRQVVVNGKQKLAHRIVATTFIPNYKNLEQINHIDGNKLNNNVDNLEWCSRSENLTHAYNNGLEKTKAGEEHPNHKLTEENVKYIRNFYIKGDRRFGSASLARKFGVDRTTIVDAYKRNTWGSVL